MCAMREIERGLDGTIHYGLFETPLSARMIPDHEELDRQLVQTILEMSKQERYREPRKWSTKFGALFESTFDFFEQPRPEIARLRDHCVGAALEEAARLCGPFWAQAGIDLSALRPHVESWFHVTRDGGRQGVHKHANHAWSGVYFVHRGSPRPGIEKNGYFRIHDPRPNISMYSDLGMIPFSAGLIDIEPQNGKLIIFPSWLAHEVLDYHGDEPRITVAFNVAIRT